MSINETLTITEQIKIDYVRKLIALIDDSLGDQPALMYRIERNLRELDLADSEPQSEGL